MSSLLTFEQQREKRLPFKKKTEYKNSLFGGWAIKIQGNSAIFLRSGDSPFTLSKTQFDSNKKKNRNMIKKFVHYCITSKESKPQFISCSSVHKLSLHANYNNNFHMIVFILSISGAITFL